ncbi:hypothetical protein SFRURICE_021469, partial [Spodoptera frugiperda]
VTQNGEIKLPREDRHPRGRSRRRKLVNSNYKQIQRDVITGFPFNIMLDTLRGARDVTNHAPLYFPSSGPKLQTRCQ